MCARLRAEDRGRAQAATTRATDDSRRSHGDRSCSLVPVPGLIRMIPMTARLRLASPASAAPRHRPEPRATVLGSSPPLTRARAGRGHAHSSTTATAVASAPRPNTVAVSNDPPLAVSGAAPRPAGQRDSGGPPRCRRQRRPRHARVRMHESRSLILSARARRPSASRHGVVALSCWPAGHRLPDTRRASSAASEASTCHPTAVRVDRGGDRVRGPSRSCTLSRPGGWYWPRTGRHRPARVSSRLRLRTVTRACPWSPSPRDSPAPGTGCRWRSARRRTRFSAAQRCPHPHRHPRPGAFLGGGRRPPAP